VYQKHQNIHFVGIGGIGMSGIAELLVNLGHKVTGSDLSQGEATRRLAKMGAKVHIGHEAENLEGAQVVVISSAVKEDNPEVQAARNNHIPVIPRAEMLAELMRLKYGLAVAGAHGKTTCTSMLASIMAQGRLDPTVVVGGRVGALGNNAWLGKGEFLVAEADESDGSFNILTPVVVVVTNVDREHMDHYGSQEALDQAFVEFMNKVPFYGASVICLDDPRLAGLIPRVRKRTITYGLASQAAYQARELRPEPGGTGFTLYVYGEDKGRFLVPVPGKHNVLNALGAIAAAQEVGVTVEAARSGLEEFGGVKRRFEQKGELPGGALVYDDYGHHPTEIRATLEAARTRWPERRIVVCFQPHRFSRTRDLFEEFARSFYGADRLLVMDIYAASEKPDPDISAERLCQAIAEHGHRGVEYVGEAEAAQARLKEISGPDDVIFTMGAGSVFLVGENLLAEAEEAH
jgi:UDP-N-acetylmuramate--alanine ligase